MTIPASTARVLAIGLVAGLLSGLLGVGGGLIIVPGLVLAVAVAQRTATATSLAAVVPIALTGALLFGTGGSVAIEHAAILALGSLVGSQIGTTVLRRTPDSWLRGAFAVFLLATAVVLAIQ